MEYFVKPGADEEWFEYWVKERFDWWTRHGIKAENLRIRPHDPDELSHYSKERRTSSTLSPGAGASSKGSRTAATST